MKKHHILIFITILHSILASGQCDYRIALKDFYGDGWTDGKLSISVNSVLVLTDITLSNGYGPEFYTFSASEDDDISIDFTAPSQFATDAEFQIFDADNNVIFEDGQNETIPEDGSFTAPACINCKSPSSLTTTSITQSNITINWTESGTATTWNIQYGESGYTLGTGTIVSDLTTESYSISELSEDTDYDIYVQSNCSETSKSDWRSLLSVTTTSVCPSPGSFDLSNIETNAATVSWVENGDATVWDMEIVKEGNAQTEIPNITGIVSQNHTIGGLTPNTQYTIYVRSQCNVSQYSKWKYAGEFTTLYDCIAPSFSSYKNLSYNAVDIYWTENGDATLWDIDIVPFGDALNSTPTVSDITTQYFNITDLEPTTTYDIYVRAKCDETHNSSWVRLTEITTLSECLTPSNFHPINVGTNFIELKWLEEGSSTSWDIEIIESENSLTTTPTYSNITEFDYTLPDLTLNTNYTVSVRSNCQSGGNSSWTTGYKFKTASAGNESNPSSCLLGISTELNHHVFVPINIDDVGILGTDIQLKEVKLLIAHDYISDLRILLISPSGEYVKIMNRNGGVGDNLGDITQTDCSSLTTFSMSGAEGSIAEGISPFLGSFIPIGDFAKFNDKSTNSKGTWLLDIIDLSAGNDGIIQHVELSFEDLSTDISDLKMSSYGTLVSIYPNPAKDYFTFSIKNSQQQTIEVELKNTTGQLLYSKTFSDKTAIEEVISTMHLSSGIYYLTAIGNSMHSTQKILISK